MHPYKMAVTKHHMLSYVGLNRFLTHTHTHTRDFFEAGKLL